MKREASLYQAASLEKPQIGDHHSPTTSQQRSSVGTEHSTFNHKQNVTKKRRMIVHVQACAKTSYVLTKLSTSPLSLTVYWDHAVRPMMYVKDNPINEGSRPACAYIRYQQWGLN